jgi:hypothetical protein
MGPMTLFPTCHWVQIQKSSMEPATNTLHQISWTRRLPLSSRTLKNTRSSWTQATTTVLLRTNPIVKSWTRRSNFSRTGRAQLGSIISSRIPSQFKIRSSPLQRLSTAIKTKRPKLSLSKAQITTWGINTTGTQRSSSQCSVQIKTTLHHQARGVPKRSHPPLPTF